MSIPDLRRLATFVSAFDALVTTVSDEPVLLQQGQALLEELVRTDDWLPDAYAEPDPERYRQYLLYRDTAARFSVVSFVWGPGQATPVHDHTVWGLVGVLRGGESSRSYALTSEGLHPAGPPHRLSPGQVEAVSPRIGDIHQVSNAFDDRLSVSIHVYGADIGEVERSTFDEDGRAKRFVSGYAPSPPLDLKPTHAAARITVPSLTPAEIRLDLLARREIALIDLREEDPYAKDHPLFAANLPLSRLELEVSDRLPRRDVRIVLYDNGERLVLSAAQRLHSLGYTQVHALEGGLQGWRDAGFELFQDVNSASKAFGELVEARRHTPSIAAPEAKALIDTEPNLVVLDARRWDEYQTMSIPRGVSTPGAELVLRARELAPDPSTTVIVNCAGRTRSIIGAQSLLNAGLPNPVYALRNGAIGWTLADLKLDHGQDRRAPEPSAEHERQAVSGARAAAYRAGVKRLDLKQLDALSADHTRTLYRFDVRPPEEYASGHLPGFRNYPGGQLIQETDVAAPVRGARIVLTDDRSVRADMSASWLAQMGWEIYVLDGGYDGELKTGPWAPNRPVLPPSLLIDAASLADGLARNAFTVIDLGPSPAHRRGHIPGAWFAIRAQLKEALEALPRDKPFVLTSPDGDLAALAAAGFATLAGATPQVLDGGTAAWAALGLPLETGLERAASPPVDVYKRPYEGADHAPAAKQAYLDWEFGLVAQLEREATHGFFVI